MHAITNLDLNSPELSRAEVTNAILDVKLSDVPTIIAFFLIRYLTRPFQFQLIEIAIQQLYDQFIDFTDIFFESLSTCEIMCTEPSQKTNFYGFINEVKAMHIFDDKEWKNRLEPETLKELNFITDVALFNRKSVRQNTALVYKQVKFNLLRESSAGYSFLLVKLSGAIKNQAPYEEVNEIVSFHIGSFNLELVRVVEFIIHLFELNVETQYNYFLGLLSNCPWFEPNGQDDQKSGVQLYSSVLGFRFANSLGESSEKLYHVAALMVKHNLAKLGLFYIQLGPSLEEWKDIFSNHLSTLKSRVNLVEVTVGQMPPDEDKDVPRSRPAEPPTPVKSAIKEQKPIDYQRTGLLKALLSIGAYRDSLWILLRQPDFLGFDPDCALLVCRLVQELLNFQGEYHSHLYAPLACAGLDKSSIGPLKRKYPVLNALLPYPDQVFYYSEWKEDINQELAEQVFEWIKLLGPNIRDSELFARLACMAKGPLRANKASPEYILWSGILRSSLFPSLIVSGGNEGCHNVLWETIGGLPVAERYSFYDDWDNGECTNSAEMKAIKFSSIRIARQVSNRITVTNSRAYGAILKTEILRCPGPVFLAMLKSIVIYSRTEQYLEVFRFLSKLAVDVFQYVALDLASSPAQRGLFQSERLKADCINTETWLRNLAVLMSSLCRRYSNFSISAIIEHVVTQLHNGIPYDVVFLSELLIKMGGFETHDNFSDLISLTGDRALRAEACPLIMANKPTAASAGRLADAVINLRFLPMLVVLLARQQQVTIFANDISPHTPDAAINDTLLPGLSSKFIQDNRRAFYSSKVNASHVDSMHDVILRLIELLSSHADPSKLGELLPSLTDFCKVYEIDVASAFAFLRPYLTFLASRDLELLQSATDEMEQGELMEDTDTTELPKDVWLPSLQPCATEFQQLFPQMTCGGICPEFYITFWQLQMSDISVPEASYKKYIDLSKLFTANERSFETPESRKANSLKIEALENELSDRRSLHQRCLQRINREKSHWFADGADPGQLAAAIVENCILPRCTFSGLDALYCANFLITLHRHKTPGFSLILVVDCIMDYFRKMLFLSTPTEARHFGLFIAELFNLFNQWYDSATAFQNEAASLFSDTNPTCPSRAQKVIQQNAAKLEGQNISSHEAFRFQMADWNQQIFNAALPCLKSGEYMQIHSTFSVLAVLEKSFPRTREHAGAFAAQIKVLLDDKEIKMNSITLSYKCIVQKLEERCVSAAAFSRIHGLLFRPPPEVRPAPEEVRPVSPTPRSTSARPTRHRSDLDRHHRSSPPQSQKRLRPESSGDSRSRPGNDSRDSRHSKLHQHGNGSHERSIRHEQLRDSGMQQRGSGNQHRDSGNQHRDSGRERRRMPSSNRESQKDSRGHHNDRNNPPGRSPPPFKRHRNDYDQPSSGNNRPSSPSASRGPRQRVENTLSSISVPTSFGNERAPRRGGLSSQNPRRLPPGSAANAHLQDNNQGRRYHR